MGLHEDGLAVVEGKCCVTVAGFKNKIKPVRCKEEQSLKKTRKAKNKKRRYHREISWLMSPFSGSCFSNVFLNLSRGVLLLALPFFDMKMHVYL